MSCKKTGQTQSRNSLLANLITSPIGNCSTQHRSSLISDYTLSDVNPSVFIMLRSFVMSASDPVLSEAMGKVDLNTSAASQQAEAQQEDVVDPWNVQTSSEKGVDYDKLVSESTTNMVSSCAAAPKS